MDRDMILLLASHGQEFVNFGWKYHLASPLEPPFPPLWVPIYVCVVRDRVGDWVLSKRCHVDAASRLGYDSVVERSGET